jgi:hypothetical protein
LRADEETNKQTKRSPLLSGGAVLVADTHAEKPELQKAPCGEAIHRPGEGGAGGVFGLAFVLDLLG